MSNVKTIEQLQKEIEGLRGESKVLENEIWELEVKKNNISKDIDERLEKIERLTYGGLTKNQYLRAIAGTVYQEGDFKIEIGTPYESFITVTTFDGDMELRISTSHTVQRGSLKLTKEPNIEKGITRWYEREYFSGDIPKSRMATYEKMLELKSKYGQMMENGEIPLR